MDPRDIDEVVIGLCLLSIMIGLACRPFLSYLPKILGLCP